MTYIRRTGIYENIKEKRWEYWLVKERDLKIMVSWLQWGCTEDEYKKWKETYTIQ